MIMDKVMKNGFAEMSVAEMTEVDGGSLTVLGVCATIAAVGGAVTVCYKAGTAVGKFIYNVSH